MKLNDVHQGITKNRKRRRIGRGPGSGHGKTAGRGHKGQGSRAGWSRHPVFQGGAMPLVRRVPKRGFNNKWAEPDRRRSTSVIWKLDFEAGDSITPERCSNRPPLLGHRYDEFKILGDGELTKKLTVSAHRFSKSAVEEDRTGGRTSRASAGSDPGGGQKEAAKSTTAASRSRRCSTCRPSRGNPQSPGNREHVRETADRLLDPRTAAEDPADAAVAGDLPHRLADLAADDQPGRRFSRSAGATGRRLRQHGRVRGRLQCQQPAARPPSSAWASCPTSRPPLSSSCWAASGSRSKNCRRKARSGRKKINEYTRYVTVLLCLVQSWFYVKLYVMGVDPGQRGHWSIRTFAARPPAICTSAGRSAPC